MHRWKLLLLALVMSAGCMPTYRVRPDTGPWAKQLKKVAVVSAVRVNEVSVGGVREEHEEWTGELRERVRRELLEGLKNQGLEAVSLEVKPGDKELVELSRLYGEVADAVWTFAYPPYASEYAVKHFPYSVGPIDSVLGRTGADALVVVWAVDNVATTGRVLTRGSSGAYSDMTLFTLGVLDREGRLQFFDVWGAYGVNLRDDASVRTPVRQVLTNLGGVLR